MSTAAHAVLQHEHLLRRIEGPLQLPLPMPAPIRFVNAAAADTSSIWRDESPNPKQARILKHGFAIAFALQKTVKSSDDPWNRPSQASPTSWPPSEADGAPVLAQQAVTTRFRERSKKHNPEGRKHRQTTSIQLARPDGFKQKQHEDTSGKDRQTE